MKKIFLILAFVIASFVGHSQAMLIKNNVRLTAKPISDCKAVELRWTIRMEDHVDYYQIEWSKNGESFDSIANELGGVWSIEPVTYNWCDIVSHMITETHYYRIKVVYWDGTFEYSNIAEAVCQKKTKKSRE